MPGENTPPEKNQSNITIVNPDEIEDTLTKTDEAARAAATAAETASQEADAAAAAVAAKQNEFSDDPESAAAKTEIQKARDAAAAAQKKRDDAIGARAMADARLRKFSSAAPVLLSVADKFNATVAATMRSLGQDPKDPDAFKAASDKAKAAIQQRKFGDLGTNLADADVVLSEVVGNALKKSKKGDGTPDDESDSVPEPGALPGGEPPDGDPATTANAKALARLKEADDWMGGSLALSKDSEDPSNANYVSMRDALTAVYGLMTEEMAAEGKKVPLTRSGRPAVVMVTARQPQ